MSAEPRPTLPFTDEELAYHEAGHVVIHVLNGGTISRVSIDRADPKRGVNVSGEPPAPRSEAEARRLIDTLLAGEAALFVRGGERRHVPDSRDRERALRAARSVAADDASAQALLDAEWPRVLDRLREPATWQKLEAVAAALLQQRTISGDEVRRLTAAG